MCYLSEALGAVTADTLGGRVGGDELGMLRLQSLQLLEQLVEVVVRDGGSREDVVGVVVRLDLLS